MNKKITPFSNPCVTMENSYRVHFIDSFSNLLFLASVLYKCCFFIVIFVSSDAFSLPSFLSPRLTLLISGFLQLSDSQFWRFLHPALPLFHSRNHEKHNYTFEQKYYSPMYNQPEILLLSQVYWSWYLRWYFFDIVYYIQWFYRWKIRFIYL